MPVISLPWLKQKLRKKICKGKKPSAKSPNNYCRCCKTVLRIPCGSTWKSVSTENLFRPSGKKGIEGEILSYQLKKKGITVERFPSPKDNENKKDM